MKNLAAFHRANVTSGQSQHGHRIAVACCEFDFKLLAARIAKRLYRTVHYIFCAMARLFGGDDRRFARYAEQASLTG